MKRPNLFFPILLLGALLSFTAFKALDVKETTTKQNGFAVLELFTSQGCSSCPPADAILAQYALQGNPNVIPMAFHVDYWNYLGWKDPFSNKQYSARQSHYASLLKAQGNYTPQLIINGKHQLVGSDTYQINNLVNKELSGNAGFHVTIKNASVINNQLNIEFDADIDPNAVVNLALIKKKELTSIKRGENNGLKQTSYNIVFDFKTIKNYAKTKNKSSFNFSVNQVPSDYMVVAYLQNVNTGAISGATKSEIN